MSKKTTYHDILVNLSLVAIVISTVAINGWNSHIIALRWGLPLLIAMSGIEILHKELAPSVRVVYSKYLPISAISCCIWWCLSALIILKDEYANEIDTDTFLECLGEALGEPYNLLFLQLIVCTYAFYPLLYRVVNDEKNNNYALVIFFLVSSLFPILKKIPYVSYLTLFTDQLNWGFFTAYGMYLFMGVYAINTSFDWYKRVVIYCSGLLSSVAMYSFTTVSSFQMKTIDTTFIDINSPLVAAQTFAVMVLVKQLVKHKPHPIFEELSKNKYGFIPMTMVSLLMLNLYFSIENLGVIWSKVVLINASFLISHLLCSVLRRIPLLNVLMLNFDDRRNTK